MRRPEPASCALPSPCQEPVLSKAKEEGPRVRVALLLCALLVAACASPTPAPPPTTTSRPDPTTTVPAALPTPSPIAPSPSPYQDYAQALRPEFVSDLDLFPDATRYEIELAVDFTLTTITGHERVDYTNTEGVALDALYLRLFPNTLGYGGAMTVTETLLDGRPLVPAVELNGSALRLPLKPPLAPGARAALALDFILSLPSEGANLPSQGANYGYRQLGYYDGVLALANAYPLIPAYDDQGWNVELSPPYGDAIYSDTAFYTVRITAPATMTLAASGTCTAPIHNRAGSATWTCVAGPMRDLNVVLGTDYQVESRVVEGVTVNSIFYPQHREAGELALDHAAETVRLFGTRVGPYPFTELDVVETPTRAGGIEYPGLVVINSARYETITERTEWVVAHEVIHQWWYSLVGNDQVDEPWLDEALTQYSTLLYFEHRYGAEAAADLLQRFFQGPYEALKEDGRDAPAGLPVAAYSDEDYGAVVYGKGPLYFHALRQEVGDDQFWTILQAYFARHRYGVATPEDWLAAVKAVTGQEYRTLYEQWIQGDEERSEREATVVQ